MTTSAPTFGVDFRSAGALGGARTILSGVDVIAQDAAHRLTEDNVLGPNGDGSGFDVRKLIGMYQPALTKLAPIVASALLRDDRVLTADVSLTSVDTNGLLDVLLVAKCMTAEGPFEIASLVSALASTWPGSVP